MFSLVISLVGECWMRHLDHALPKPKRKRYCSILGETLGVDLDLVRSALSRIASGFWPVLTAYRSWKLSVGLRLEMISPLWRVKVLGWPVSL